IGGNSILWGASWGGAFWGGVVGERFAVRNSGAHAVVEGVGDHGCEYMTGGRAVILGRTGRNFAAGMSGGVAYVYDPEGVFPGQLNTEMVDLDPFDDNDSEWLQDMIAAHVDATNSAVGQRILADWPVQQQYFVKVMPRDYKQVLQAIAEAELSGSDVGQAVMAAAHG
ncbi:MAG: glutamate synthase subunit alpha, partial [Mycobacteriaceae bacterium]|nr:glutamate synthase subunit alpha [Mycobacteriaceae bacterium]